jgi:hypothetical protein
MHRIRTPIFREASDFRDIHASPAPYRQNVRSDVVIQVVWVAVPRYPLLAVAVGRCGTDAGLPKLVKYGDIRAHGGPRGPFARRDVTLVAGLPVLVAWVA